MVVSPSVKPTPPPSGPQHNTFFGLCLICCSCRWDPVCFSIAQNSFGGPRPISPSVFFSVAQRHRVAAPAFLPVSAQGPGLQCRMGDNLLIAGRVQRLKSVIKVRLLLPVKFKYPTSHVCLSAVCLSAVPPVCTTSSPQKPPDLFFCLPFLLGNS